MQLLMLFLPEVVGTLIGAALGLWSAQWWDHRKDARQTQESTLRTIDSLIGEIALLRGAAQAAVEPQDPADAEVALPGGAMQVTVDMLFLPNAAFQSAVGAGGLGLLPATLQVQLSTFYEAVAWTRMHRDNIMTSYDHAVSVDHNVGYLRNARNYLAAGSQWLLSEVDNLLEQLRRHRSAVAAGNHLIA